jgi:hypothetical protein
LVELAEWVDVPPWVEPLYNDGGLDEPLIRETLCTNKLALNLGSTKLAVETVDGNVHRGFAGCDDTLNSLGGQLHYLHLRLGTNPDTFSDSNASLWEGISVVSGKVDGAPQQLALDVSSLVKATFSEMRSELLAEAKSKTRQECVVSVNLMRNEMRVLRLECRQVLRDCGTFTVKIGNISREQGLLNQQPTLDPSFTREWQHVLDFFVWNTTPGSGRVGDVLDHGLLAASRCFGDPVDGVPAVGLANLAKEVAELRDSSKDVTIDNFTSALLSYTVEWVTHNFPSDPDQALVCLDAPTLLHIIGKYCSTNQNTREALYQSTKAGISKFCPQSSLQFPYGST